MLRLTVVLLPLLLALGFVLGTLGEHWRTGVNKLAPFPHEGVSLFPHSHHYRGLIKNPKKKPIADIGRMPTCDTSLLGLVLVRLLT